MGAKPLKKPHLKPFFEANDFSNPSGSTNKTLTFNKLASFTDKLLTKMNYKKPKIYDAGGDIKKQWFVYYSFRNPDTGVFKRWKVFENINEYKTKSERTEVAKFYQESYLEWLRAGNSPHNKSAIEEVEKAQNIIVCIDKFIGYIDGNGEYQSGFLDGTKMRFNTKKKYKYELSVFKSWLQTTNYDRLTIGKIKKQYIFEFIEYIKKRSKVKSGKTVNHYLDDLRRFFNHYMDNFDDYLERNPAARITRDIVETKGNIPYTDKEFEAIKKYLLENDPYLWFVCQVIYYTGLRNEAEALYVKIGDFDLKNNKLWVEAWVAKNKIRQSLPIYPEFKELLLKIDIENYPSDWYLFGRNDKPGPVRVGIDNFARRFRPVKKHFGFGDEYGLYPFKHTRACHLFDDGAEIRDIQLLFRHQTPLITMEYLKSLGRIERQRTLDKGRKI